MSVSHQTPPAPPPRFSDSTFLSKSDEEKRKLLYKTVVAAARAQQQQVPHSHKLQTNGDARPPTRELETPPGNKRKSAVDQQTFFPCDIGELESAERLDNRVQKEKRNLRGSLSRRRRPSRSNLRGSDVTINSDENDSGCVQTLYVLQNDDVINTKNETSSESTVKIPHKQSVLVLPKVPPGGIKLNSVSTRINGQQINGQQGLKSADKNLKIPQANLKGKKSVSWEFDLDDHHHQEHHQTPEVNNKNGHHHQQQHHHNAQLNDKKSKEGTTKMADDLASPYLIKLRQRQDQHQQQRPVSWHQGSRPNVRVDKNHVQQLQVHQDDDELSQVRLRKTEPSYLRHRVNDEEDQRRKEWAMLKNAYNAQQQQQQQKDWRRVEEDMETSRRSRVEVVTPDWVQQAQDKRKSFESQARVNTPPDAKWTSQIQVDGKSTPQDGHTVTDSNNYCRVSAVDGSRVDWNSFERRRTPDLTTNDSAEWIKEVKLRKAQTPSSSSPYNSLGRNVRVSWQDQEVDSHNSDSNNSVHVISSSSSNRPASPKSNKYYHRHSVQVEVPGPKDHQQDPNDSFDVANYVKDLVKRRKSGGGGGGPANHRTNKPRPLSTPDMAGSLTPDWLTLVEKRNSSRFDWENLDRANTSQESIQQPEWSLRRLKKTPERVHRSTEEQPCIVVKLRGTSDTDSLDRSRGTSPSGRRMRHGDSNAALEFDDDEVLSESDSSAFSWHEGIRMTSGSLPALQRPDWIGMAENKQRSGEWERLEIRQSASSDAEEVAVAAAAPWVHAVRLKSPAPNANQRQEDRGFRLPDVELRHVEVTESPIVGNGRQWTSSPELWMSRDEGKPEWVEIAEKKTKVDINWVNLENEARKENQNHEVPWSPPAQLKHVRTEEKTTSMVFDSSENDDEDDYMENGGRYKLEKKIVKFDGPSSVSIRRRRLKQHDTETLTIEQTPDWFEMAQQKQNASIDWQNFESQSPDRKSPGIPSPWISEIKLKKTPERSSSVEDDRCSSPYASMRSQLRQVDMSSGDVSRTSSPDVLQINLRNGHHRSRSPRWQSNPELDDRGVSTASWLDLAEKKRNSGINWEHLGGEWTLMH